MGNDASQSPLLQVSRLVKEFPLRGSPHRVHAVNGVSFTIAAGETLALVGESGSGKTTVGRCILGLLKPTSGEVRFRGERVDHLTNRQFRALRPRIQLVSQEPHDSLNPRRSVYSTIVEPLQLQHALSKTEQRRRVVELMDAVGLGSRYARKLPGALSDNEAQRVNIARAMATRPDLVVLDEPTSSLDIAVRIGIVDLLGQLQATLGVAYLFISHDLTAVRHISDRVCVMYLGQIVEEAPTKTLFAGLEEPPAKQLFEHARHPYSIALLSSVLYPDPATKTEPFVLAGEIPSPVVLPRGCFLSPRCPMVIAECASEIALKAVVAGTHSVRCIRAQGT